MNAFFIREIDIINTPRLLYNTLSRSVFLDVSFLLTENLRHTHCNWLHIAEIKQIDYRKALLDIKGDGSVDL